MKSWNTQLNMQDKLNIGLAKAKDNNFSLPQIPSNKINSCMRRNFLHEKFSTSIVSFKSNKLRKRKSMDQEYNNFF